MNFLDILFILLMLYVAWRGYKRGFIIEIATLLALLLGLYAGVHFSDWTAEKIGDSFNFNPNYLPVIAFTLTFLGVGAMVYFGGKSLEKTLKIVGLGLFNRVLGALIGVAKIAYVLSIVIVLIETYDERGSFFSADLKQSSTLYYPLSEVSQITIPAIKKSNIWLHNNLGKAVESIENKSNP